jgi:hypothetical protein
MRGQAVEGGAQAAGCRVRQPDAGQVAGGGVRQLLSVARTAAGSAWRPGGRAAWASLDSRSEEHQKDAVFSPPKAAGDKELPGRRAGA